METIIAVTAIVALLVQSYLHKMERDELTKKIMARNLTEYYQPEVMRRVEEMRPADSEPQYVSLQEMENDPVALQKVHAQFDVIE